MAARPEPAHGAYCELRQLVRLEAVRGFSFLPRQPVRSLLSGRHGSRLRGRGLDFEELRRYLPGDDVRDIDWRVTARTRKVHVRVHTEERDRPVLLLVDQRRSMFFGSRRVMKSVAAAEAAAVVAWRSLDVGDRVGALVFGDEDVVELRPERSRAAVLRLLQAVTRANHRLRADHPEPPQEHMLDRVLEQARRLANHDHLVCVISDLRGADAATERLASQLAEHNDVLVFFVHDPLEREMADVGRVVAAQGELQLEIDTGLAALRRRFADDFAARLDVIGRAARRKFLGLLTLSTHEEVAPQILRQLGHHGPGAS